jgi:cytochrome c553
MCKIGSLSLLTGASIVALTVGALLAHSDDKSGQGNKEAAGEVAAGGAAVPDRPDWNWDVRPILSQNCFSCHGQATQKAGLRLDIPEAAYGPIPDDKNKRAIVAGNPRRSELYRRISSTDPDYRMPPKEAHKTLSAREVAVIERWIAQGALYKPHWAYIPPTIVSPEKTRWEAQALNEIDRYVYAKLAKEGLSPSPQADRETLINRVTLDLTGLPPTLEEVDAFVNDKGPDAYEKLVDRLLASIEYAERQTNVWLDAARFADSRGGLNDNERPISYPYRDWVISAFHRNMPYDRFVTWQLAGDQLANPTREQLLATAFLKAGRQDSEGGSIDEEFRMNYVHERTELIGKDFLGLTVGCAKCHDHKYDVISQADYYSLAGIFNQMDERGFASFSRGTPRGATLEWPTELQSKKLADAHAVTVAKEAAYQNALRAAQQKAAAALAAMAEKERAGFIEASIAADTQAYFPLDSGYTGDFSSLYLEPQELPLGVPLEGEKSPFDGMTRAQAIASLQKQILDDVRAGKPTPMVGAEAAAAGAPNQPGSEATMLDAAKEPGEGKLGLADARAGGPAGKGGSHEATLRDERAGAAGEPGLVKTSLADAARQPGAPSAKGPSGPSGPVTARRRDASPFGRRASMAGDLAAMKADPGLPRLAAREVDWAMEQLIARGYTDDRLGDPQRISKRQLQQWVHPEALQWTDSGLGDGKKGFVSNVKFVPGHKGQGIQLHDSVFSADKSIGMFERTQPYSLDFWLKLRTEPYVDATRPNGPSASVLYNNGSIEGQGYEISMANGKLSYSITHLAPREMLQVSTTENIPTGRWVHITSTYDGNSKAEGMHLYVDGREQPVQIDHNQLTRSSIPRGANSQFGSYFGLAAGVNFNRPELVDGALDEIRVITRALTPLEVAYLQDPKAVLAVPAQDALADMAMISAQKDPAVQKAWQELTAARLNEQRVETPVYRIMIAGDQPIPRKNYVLDRGVYNSYRQEVQAQALPRVFPWNEKLPRNRLGLATWLFDPKHPLTARVYVNRMWQSHFGNGIVQTADDFGTQGANPTHPELLDYLAVEFIRSGWDIKHMHRLMVMSAAYRQNSNISAENLEKDARNFLVERGPRLRMPAETIRDNALMISGLLVKKVGGDAVFPYAPDAIWDGVAQGAVIYPTNVPAEENYRRSMYTFVKRNAPVANLVPFDMPDRRDAQVMRPTSNTPLQGLVMLNDTQFMEAYRKLAERAIKSSANEDEQLITMWRLAVRRHPDESELTTVKAYRASELTLMQKSPGEVKKLNAIGLAPADPAVDPVELAALTVVAASVMNTPDAYTVR